MVKTELKHTYDPTLSDPGLNKKYRIRRIGLMLVGIWTLVLSLILVWNLWQVKTHTEELALRALQMGIQRDLIFRHWATRHGGVYVPVTETTKPNPYLQHIEERDIITESGKHLTLINPAYMMRQVYELSNERDGLYGRLTSLEPVSPENVADQWEAEALEAFTTDVTAMSTFADFSGEPVMRLIMPFYTEVGCLRCHSQQGMEVGQLHGGISVAASMQPYAAEMLNRQFSLGAGYAFIWLIGIGGIGWTTCRLETLTQKKDASEKKYRTIVDNTNDALYLLDFDGNILDVNANACRMLGYSAAELLDRNMAQVDNLWDMEQMPARVVHLKGNKNNVFESTHFKKSGEQIPVEISAKVISYEGQGVIQQFVRDITDRKLSELKLRESEEKFRSLVTQMEQGLAVHEVLYDEGGKAEDYRIIDVNPRFEKLTGLDKDKILGKTIREVMPDLEIQWLDKFRDVVETGESREFDNYSSELGRHFHIVAYRPQPDYLAIILSDITERIMAEAELKTTKEASEAANLAKSRFLANMSHEIRTPMSVIIGMAELLHESAHDQQEKEDIEMIMESAHSLLALINDILDFSKIEAGKLELKLGNVDLYELVERAVSSFGIQAEQKGLNLSFSVAEDVPRIVIGDALRLQQILVNLIGNAVKFTKQGEVVVNILLDERENDVASVLFSISDTGIGIPQEKIDQLFESFTQVDSSGTRKYEGTGLGLAISRSLVTMMDGAIGLESEANYGSTFFFTVPFPLPARQGDLLTRQEKLIPKCAPCHDIGSLKILVVEDKPMNQKLITLLLERKSHQVDTAVNGKVAVEKFAANCYDVVLMDVHMPEMDGLEATARIRALEQERGCYTPIIAVTAFAMKDDKVKCLQAGMDYYISKPINSAELYATLAQAVEKKK